MRYAACPDQHYDDATGVCAQVVFVDQPALLPDLPAGDAALISGAIIAACASAWGVKQLVRFIRSN